MIYRFDLGNSSEGPIGSVVDVEATSPEEAVKKLGGWFDVDCPMTESDSEGELDCRVYINPDHITVDMITEEFERWGEG